MNERIRAKAKLGLPLTERERALFILFIASDKELKDFLKREKEKNEKNNIYELGFWKSSV